MDLDITFTYDGKKYRAPSKAYDVNLIILPDGRAIEADGWNESLPPRPVNLHEVPHLFQALDPKEIAIQLHGVLAVLVF